MKQQLLLIVTLFIIVTARGQSCNCDVTLSGLSSTSLNLIWASNVNYLPGDTICIPAGNYRGFRFYNFEGTAQDPITIINCGGKVEIVETAYSGIAFKNSKHIRLSGTGDSGYTYGIHVKETTSGASVGVGLEDLSTDFEIDHIEIENTGFAGIMAKTDPSCSKPETWRANGFILKNLKVHHNYIHDTGAEGIYIGYTGGYKVKSNRKCNGEYIFGHWLEDVEVNNNFIENTGWDAIQVNLVRMGGKIHDNHIYNHGLENKYAQDFAMSIGGGIYEVYNNYIENGNDQYGQGLQFISAESGTKVYNNVIIKPDFHGVFIHNRHEFDDPGEGYYVLNNTIVEPGDSGVYYNTVITQTEDPSKLYDTQENVPTYFVNNLVVDPGSDHGAGNTWKGDPESYFDFNKRIERDSSLVRIYTNITTRQVDTLGLTDVLNYDFSPVLVSSDVVDVGSNIASWGVTFDKDNASRPSGVTFDIGAFEFQSGGTPLKVKLPDDNDFVDVLFKETHQTLFYPNPTSTFFRLQNGEYEDAIIQLITTEGKVVYKGPYKMGAPFNVEGFRAGLYFLKLIAKNGTEVHRLVIR